MKKDTGSVQADNKAAEWEKLLKSKGYRLTLPRRVILNLMLQSNEHLNAKEIYSRININFPDIGLTTVYRTLDLLVELGLINRFEFGDGYSSYELGKEAKNHHHHLICSKCGKIIDYSDFIEDEVKFFSMIEKYLAQKHNFVILGHEVQFYGHCEKCRS